MPEPTKTTESTEITASPSASSSGREDEAIVFDNPGPEIDLTKAAIDDPHGTSHITRWFSTFEWMVIVTRKGNDMTSTPVRLTPKKRVTLTLESGSKVGEITLDHEDADMTGQRFVNITGHRSLGDGFDEVVAGKKKWKPKHGDIYKITRIQATRADSTSFDENFTHDKIIVTFLPTPM
jgi:hypothetical protein